MRRLTILLVLAAAAGCGGSDEPLTHDEFVAKADDICADYNDKLDEAFAGLDEDSSADEWEEGARNYADTYVDMTDELTDLEAPENDRAIAQYLDRLKRNARGFDDGAGEGKLLTENFRSAANNSLYEARDRADAAGLRECSSLD